MTRNVVTRALLVLIGGFVALTAVLAIPAQAAGTAIIERDGEPVSITVNGGTLVDTGETVDDVWVLNGRAVIRGQVEGSVIVLNGGAAIAGSVGGDVIVVRGGVWVGPEAVVRGDVSGSRDVTENDGAIVDGTVEETSVLGGLGRVLPLFRSALWIGLTIALLGLGAALMVFAGDTVQRAHDAVAERPFGAAIRGAGLLVVLPLLALLTIASIIGGLLGLYLVALTGLTALAGLAVAAAGVARWILPRTPLLVSFAVGALMFRIIALVPYLGDLVTAIASIFGVGALLLAWNRREDHETEETTMAETPETPETSVPVGATASGASEGMDLLAGPGVNIDLRPGHQAPPPADDRFSDAPVPAPQHGVPLWQETPVPAARPDGHSWLDRVLADTSTTAAAVDLQTSTPTIDLSGTSPTPTVATSGPEPFTKTSNHGRSGPQVIASVPVREEFYADDPQGPPGNGERRSLFSDRSHDTDNSHTSRQGTPLLFTESTTPSSSDGNSPPVPLFTNASPDTTTPAPARSALFTQPATDAAPEPSSPPPAPRDIFTPPSGPTNATEPVPVHAQDEAGTDPTRMPSSVATDPFTVVRSGTGTERPLFGTPPAAVRDRLFPDSATASIGDLPSGGKAWRPGRG